MATDAILWKLSKLCPSSSESDNEPKGSVSGILKKESWVDPDSSVRPTELFHEATRGTVKRPSSVFYRQSRFTVGQGGSLFESRTRCTRTTFFAKADFSNIDTKMHFRHFRHRNAADAKYKKPYDITTASDKRRIDPKTHHFVEAEPSYTRFKVPFQMTCAERYAKNVKKYDQQFTREIAKLVDNQSSARDATYFVRMVAYTTLWPPYHNERELNDTSTKFYRLTPTEEARLHNIMSTDFSYC